tara:strand:- start:477 stop:1154 length:678 start_codon:yes stop_codon:yes gene_type:complete
MIKAVIFDLDNTLLDFMDMKSKSIDSAVYGMIDAGLNMSVDSAKKEIYRIYDERGIEHQEVFDEFITNELGHIDHKILAAGIVSYRKVKEATLSLYSNVNSTLVELARMGIKLAVVSDAPSREAWIRICSVNLQHMFDTVITFDDTCKRKPSPEPFMRAVNELDVKTEECIMIGDWPERDVLGASKIGMVSVFARYGNTFGTVDSGADYEIDDISEIIKIVKKLS